METYIEQMAFDELQVAIKEDNCLYLVAVLDAVKLKDEKMKTLKRMFKEEVHCSSKPPDTNRESVTSNPHKQHESFLSDKDQRSEELLTQTSGAGLQVSNNVSSEQTKVPATYLVHSFSYQNEHLSLVGSRLDGDSEVKSTNRCMPRSFCSDVAKKPNYFDFEKLQKYSNFTTSFQGVKVTSRWNKIKSVLSKNIQMVTLSEEDYTVLSTELWQILGLDRKLKDPDFWGKLSKKVGIIFESICGSVLWMQCAEFGSINCLKLLVHLGMNVDFMDEKMRRTALIATALTGNAECLQHLLIVGAKADHRFLKTSPLVCAAKMGHTECVQSLLMAGVKVNKSALIAAAEYGSVHCLELLLKFGADANSCDHHTKKTALICAVQQGHADCVTCLSAAGANLNHRDSEGKTALLYAAFGQPECLRRLLVAGASIFKTDRGTGKTAFMLAAESGSVECLQILLHWSVAVHLSSPCGPVCEKLTQGSLSSEYSALEKLVVNMPDKIRNSSKTPLMCAAEEGQLGSVLFLIQSGVHLENSVKSIALINATSALCNFYKSSLCNSETDITTYAQCIKILVESGADIKYENKCQESALNLIFTPDSVANLKMRLKDFIPAVIQHEGGLRKIYEDKISYWLLPEGLITIQVILQTMPAFIFNNPHPWLEHVYCPCFSEDTVSKLVNYNLSPLLSSLFKYHNKVAQDFSSFPFPISDMDIMTEDMITRYLIANSVFAAPDGNIQETLLLKQKIETIENISVARGEREILLQEICSNPWPLVKLAYVAVSTMMNMAQSRQHAITCSPLPEKIKSMLMLESEAVHLCITHWSRIPLEFDPSVYETLPRARPLLYNWPIGLYLETCGCSFCGPDGLKYATLESEEDG